MDAEHRPARGEGATGGTPAGSPGGGGAPGGAEGRLGPGMDLRALASAPVLDADGRRVGRVHDVFLDDRTGELAAVSVAMGRILAREVIVPADLLRLADPGQLQVPCDRDRLRAGMASPDVAHLDPRAIRDARSALTGEDVTAADAEAP